MSSKSDIEQPETSERLGIQSIACSQFVVFVDGIDGDVYPDWDAMTHGVTHAFKNGAEEVTIKKWPSENASDDRQLPAASRPESNHDENSG
jgi:hypothetical protein